MTWTNGQFGSILVEDGKAYLHETHGGHAETRSRRFT